MLCVAVHSTVKEKTVVGDLCLKALQVQYLNKVRFTSVSKKEIFVTGAENVICVLQVNTLESLSGRSLMLSLVIMFHMTLGHLSLLVSFSARPYCRPFYFVSS